MVWMMTATERLTKSTRSAVRHVQRGWGLVLAVANGHAI